jgi:hypothetical protein
VKTKRCLTYIENGLDSSVSLYNNFKYTLVETPYCLKLNESFIGKGTTIGCVKTWKKKLISRLAQSFDVCDEKEKGYRLFLAFKLLNEIKSPRKADYFLITMKKLTYEETVFWVWQYHSYGKNAISALKCIHINFKGKRNP